jgi:hypothetical protein
MHRQIIHRSGLLALLGASALPGCSEGSTVVTTVIHPTLVSVTPEDFLGSVPCVDAAGAMRSYVATIWDMGPRDAPSAMHDPAAAPQPEWFPLPSSGPVPCTQSVGFARVVPGNRYYAEIHGYDRPNLVQLLPSVDVLFDADSGERVAPRWSTQCTRSVRPGTDEAPAMETGDADDAGESEPFGVTARASTVRTIHGCNPLVDVEPRALTSVSVSLDAALGSLSCGDAEGAIARFEVQAPSGELLTAACGESVTLEDVASGALVLPVLAYAASAADDEPSFGTTCTATAAPGAAVSASCLPLTDQGALRVSPPLALEALGLTCNDIASLTLSVLQPNPEDEDEEIVTEVRSVSASQCERSVTFSGLLRGTAARVAVDAMLRDASASGTALCSARIVPSQTRLADCAPSP